MTVGFLAMGYSCIKIIGWFISRLTNNIMSKYRLFYEFYWFLQRKEEIKELIEERANESDKAFLKTKK